jgi:AraC-like DNA-binding protein
MVRLGQRTELDAYFRQFLGDLEAVAEADMPLARARFISLVTTLVTSTLEIGAPPEVEATIASAAADATKADTSEGLLRLAHYYLAHATTCARPNANRFAQQTIEKCQVLIAESFALAVSDSELAHQVGLSRSHFRYLFKEVTGMPFKRYLSQVRLTEARRLITTTRRPIRDICFDVGYSDQSSFHRAYRAYHGVPPTADRHATI